MEILFSVRRSVLLVVLVLLLGFLESVESATPELPLLPPIDVAQQSSSTAGSETPQSQVELLMIRLIRTFFGDQVKWSPFIRNDHVHTHHRIVHEHRPHPYLHDIELAKRRFHLRGKPAFLH